MNETEKPYRHSKLHGKCVASCNECIAEESRSHGIAEGLRMAAEICRFEYFRWLETGNAISNHGIFELLRAKAKEVEEGK